MGGRAGPGVTVTDASGTRGVNALIAASIRAASAALVTRTLIARAAFDNADVDGRAALVVVQRVERQDLVRELDHGTDPFFWRDSRVCRAAHNLYPIDPRAFARSLERAAGKGRLQD